VTIEQAIETAIGYETRVRDIYRNAAEKSGSDIGKGFFSMMADEEQGHLDYLNNLKTELKTTGKIPEAPLRSIVPGRAKIEASVKTVKAAANAGAGEEESGFLRDALKVETETNRFYKDAVSRVKEEARPVFARFLEIEDGHLLVVQLELDTVHRTGDYFQLDRLE